MPKGNPNPSPETRFKKGVSGNPSGRSKIEMKAMHKAAQISALMREAALSSLQDKVNKGEDPLDFIDANILKLFKDSEDRMHGTPIATVDNKSSDGSMTPTKITREIVQPKGKE